MKSRCVTMFCFHQNEDWPKLLATRALLIILMVLMVDHQNVIFGNVHWLACSSLWEVLVILLRGDVYSIAFAFNNKFIKILFDKVYSTNNCNNSIQNFLSLFQPSIFLFSSFLYSFSYFGSYTVTWNKKLKKNMHISVRK